MILGGAPLSAIPLAGALGETLVAAMFDASEHDVDAHATRIVVAGDIAAMAAENIRISVLYDGYSVDVFNQIGITIL